MTIRYNAIMPTYEYECMECNQHFEAFQAMSDEPIKNCPKCGKEVRRLIFGGTGVIFKGSGFYVTDKNGGRGGSSKSKSGTDGASSGESAKASVEAPCAGCQAASSSTGCQAGNEASGGEKAKDKATSAA